MGRVVNVAANGRGAAGCNARAAAFAYSLQQSLFLQFMENALSAFVHPAAIPKSSGAGKGETYPFVKRQRGRNAPRDLALFFGAGVVVGGERRGALLSMAALKMWLMRVW